MISSILIGLAAVLFGTSTMALPASDADYGLGVRQSSCTNSATSRNCWSDGFDINTDFYLETPDTGVTREYWLSAERADCSADGVNRTCITFNGTVPGPLITADWGDTLTVHVTNNLPDNGTSVHWHGIRQLNSSEMDGVPGVTQCPIAPGDTMTYSFRLLQYGTTWYHSHFTLQYADGIFGPLVINGPASANYDEDLGTLFLQDWSHIPAFTRWGGNPGGNPTLENIALNGTNTYTDQNTGVTTGSKMEVVVEQGKTYRLRLINVAIDGGFNFHIDGHNITVIATDLVPVNPYETDQVAVHIGQRYDIIFTANAESGDYWIRSGWNTNCHAIGNSNDIAVNGTGILRYDSSSTVDPTTQDALTVVPPCFDENVASLSPVVGIDVTNLVEVVDEVLNIDVATKSYLTWTFNTSSLWLDWDNPTLKQVHDGNSSYAASENVVTVGSGFAAGDWVVLLVDEYTHGIGVNHPLHLHGHDFFILAQKNNTVWDGTTDTWNLKNPERRDVAILPQSGYIAMAFQLDNPGAWIMHCHIAWHAGSGLSMQFVESPDNILTSGAIGGWDTDAQNGGSTCANWNSFIPNMPFEQDDSGI